MDAHFQCYFCPMGFSDIGALERHMKKTHEVSPYDQSITSQITGVPVFNSEGKLLLPSKVLGNNLGFGTSPVLSGSRPVKSYHKGKSGSATLQNLHDKLKQKRDQTIGGVYASWVGIKFQLLCFVFRDAETNQVCLNNYAMVKFFSVVLIPFC